jgi:hypothetical protein
MCAWMLRAFHRSGVISRKGQPRNIRGPDRRSLAELPRVRAGGNRELVNENRPLTSLLRYDDPTIAAFVSPTPPVTVPKTVGGWIKEISI